MDWFNSKRTTKVGSWKHIPLQKSGWARMDSNHRTPKRTDLQSVAVGHLATCPVQSQRRDSNPRPADYKSAALPTELLWRDPEPLKIDHQIFKEHHPIKTQPAFFGKAKVIEFVNSENFEKEIFQRGC
jgi:hypothetical protein